MPPLRRFKSFAPGYFETMGIRLVAGRSITWSEVHEQRPVIVISETLAGSTGESLRARSAGACAPCSGTRRGARSSASPATSATMG